MYLKPTRRNTPFTRDNQDFLYARTESEKNDFISRYLQTPLELETFKEYKSYQILNDITIRLNWSTDNAIEDLKKNCFVSYDGSKYELWHVENSFLVNAKLIEFKLVKDVISSTVNIIDRDRKVSAKRGTMEKYIDINNNKYLLYNHNLETIIPADIDALESQEKEIHPSEEHYLIYTSDTPNFIDIEVEPYAKAKPLYNNEELPYHIYVLPKSNYNIPDIATIDTVFEPIEIPPDKTIKDDEVVETNTYRLSITPTVGVPVPQTEFFAVLLDKTTGVTTQYNKAQIQSVQTSAIKVGRTAIGLIDLTTEQVGEELRPRLKYREYEEQKSLLKQASEDPTTIKITKVKFLKPEINQANIDNGVYREVRTINRLFTNVLELNNFSFEEEQFVFQRSQDNISNIDTDYSKEFLWYTEPVVHQYPLAYYKLATDDDTMVIDPLKLPTTDETIKITVQSGAPDVTGATVYRVSQGDYNDSFQTREEIQNTFKDNTLATSEWLQYKVTNFELDNANLKLDKANETREFRANSLSSIASVGDSALWGAISGKSVAGAGVGAVGAGINIAGAYYASNNRKKTMQEKFDNQVTQIRKRPPSMKLNDHKVYTTNAQNGCGAKLIKVEAPDEIRKGVAFFQHMYGSPVERLMPVVNLLRRHWFNYLELENVSEVINDRDRFSSIELGVIDTLFTNGIRLWRNDDNRFKGVNFDVNNS